MICTLISLKLCVCPPTIWSPRGCHMYSGGRTCWVWPPQTQWACSFEPSPFPPAALRVLQRLLYWLHRSSQSTTWLIQSVNGKHNSTNLIKCTMNIFRISFKYLQVDKTTIVVACSTLCFPHAVFKWDSLIVLTLLIFVICLMANMSNYAKHRGNISFLIHSLTVQSTAMELRTVPPVPLVLFLSIFFHQWQSDNWCCFNPLFQLIKWWQRKTSWDLFSTVYLLPSVSASYCL